MDFDTILWKGRA